MKLYILTPFVSHKKRNRQQQNQVENWSKRKREFAFPFHGDEEEKGDMIEIAE